LCFKLAGEPGREDGWLCCIVGGENNGGNEILGASEKIWSWLGNELVVWEFLLIFPRILSGLNQNSSKILGILSSFTLSSYSSAKNQSEFALKFLKLFIDFSEILESFMFKVWSKLKTISSESLKLLPAFIFNNLAFKFLQTSPTQKSTDSTHWQTNELFISHFRSNW
jgi:hypothetical protein